MGYVEKLQDKQGNEADIHDKRVDGIKADDGKLIVPEVAAGPQPVAEFDGVDYYHKHEFDLEEISLVPTKYYDLFTGDEIAASYADLNQTAHLFATEHGGGPAAVKTVLFVLGNKLAYNRITYTVYVEEGKTEPVVDYTSRSFTIVSSAPQNNDEICLPDNITAYYGFLSEDGKTFISYWNEEGDGAIKKISEVTDGTNTAKIADPRLDAAPEGTLDKVLGLNSNNEVVKGAVSGGTKLYIHNITGINYGMTSVTTLISSDNTPITDVDSLSDQFTSKGFALYAGSYGRSYFRFADIAKLDNIVYGVSASLDPETLDIVFIKREFGSVDKSLTDTVTEL